MSDTHPTIRVGDRVRIMQTAEMERRGLSNKIGIATRVGRKLATAIVMVNDDVFLSIPLSALTKAPLEISK